MVPANRPARPSRCSALLSAAIALLASAGLAQHARAQTLAAQAFVSGLTKPTAMTFAPGDPTRLYVIEQRGNVKLIKNGVLQATPFLNYDAQVPEQTYSGLLGIAFHPNYASNGKFYLYHTTGTSGAITVWLKEFTRSPGNPDTADVSSMHVILSVASPASPAYHLGGTLAFGPDNMLYLAFGDGGDTGFEIPGGQRSQSDTSYWGKLIRIDVDHDDFPADTNRNYAIPADNPYAGSPTVLNEIFARGLRNPFRMSFDRETGHLWIGDVGAVSREEIDVVNLTSDGGANFGWSCAEGKLCTTNAACSCGAVLKSPVVEYMHGSVASVTGGVMYRGCAIPALVGTYVYADYQANKLYSFKYNYDTGAVSSYTDRTSQVTSPSLSTPVCIAEDFLGELYLVEHTAGRIRKIVSNPLPVDSDGDGIPDTCEPPLGDLNGDYRVDGTDLGLLLGGWGTAGVTDLNGDGSTDGTDLGLLLGNWTV